MATEFYSFLGISFTNMWLTALLHSAFYIALYVLGRIGLKFIKVKALEKIKQRTNPEIKTEIFQTFYRLTKRVLQLYLAFYVITSIPFLDKHNEFFFHVFYVFGLFLALVTISKITDYIIYFAFHGKTKDLAPLTGRIAKIIIATIGLMIGLRHFDQDIWHIATALGIGSLAVGLAAQPTLTNFIAGFNILIDHPFRVGDRIRLATGDIGDVVDIGLRSTHLRTTDGNTLIVPNSELGNSRVINYSMPDNGVSNSVKFQFDLNADVTKIKLVLSDALRNIDGLAQPVDVLLSGIYNGIIEMNLIVKATDYSLQGKVTDKVIQESLYAFRKNGIAFAENRFKMPH